MFVCLYWSISLAAEPIGFSLTGQVLIGPGKVYNYFEKSWKIEFKKKYLRDLNETLVGIVET